MASPRKADASTRTSTTDLDRPGASFDFLPLIYQDPASPVLHLLRARRELMLDRPSSATMEAIVQARGAAEVGPGANSAWMDPDDWLGYSLPRGVAWTDYPVLGNPRHRTVRSMPVPAISSDRNRLGAAPSYSQAELSSRVGLVLIHRPPNLDSGRFDLASDALRWVSAALQVAEALGPAAAVVSVGPDATVTPDAEDLRTAAAGHAPWLRFRYSYAANFYAIAARPLERSLETVDPRTRDFLNRVSIRSYEPDRSNPTVAAKVRGRAGLAEMADPLTLQVLYDLRRKGRVAVSPRNWREGWSSALFEEGADGLPCWVGTGRHPARPLDRKEVDDAVFALARHHMICMEGDDLVVSLTGEAWLGMLHPDCEDPDMPLRWARNPLAEADGAAMDAWIGRTFRKMKARVNEIG